MIRESGLYARQDGHHFHVVYRVGPFVARHDFEGDPHTGGLVHLDDLDVLERVTTTALWQDTPVVVERLFENRMAWIRTTDVALAERLRLYGGLSTGWGAAVRLYELEGITEEIEDLLRR